MLSRGLQTRRALRSPAWRLWHSLWRQRRRSLRCPDGPRLDGHRALVTGGARGIGLAVTRDLTARGAEVVAASRSARGGNLADGYLPLDLADLDTVRRALDDLDAAAPQALDIVVANAGLWPQGFAQSAQGHEIAFATNVLGHHALLRGLQRRGLLASDARIVFVTGDIYVLADDCTPDYRYRGALGGQLAYCRSKLGNLWQTREFARRFPGLRVTAAHPGVVASGLAGPETGVVGATKRALFLAPEDGAQTPLYCATQPNVDTGDYLHNTLGRVQLEAEDPAASGTRATAFWNLLEDLVAEV